MGIRCLALRSIADGGQDGTGAMIKEPWYGIALL